MLILDNIISAEEISQFKQYFIENFHKKYVNWQLDNDTIDYRLTVNSASPLFNIVNRIVDENFKNPIKIWAAYQRQSRPHEIHIDDYGKDQADLFRYTYILAMDTVPEFKAIVWKEKCSNNDQLNEFVSAWGETRMLKEKTSLVSSTEDLEHTFDSNQQDYLADYLELDGIYQYKTGTACLFDATQLHCSSNWLKHKQYPYRELLQIHVLSAESIDC